MKITFLTTGNIRQIATMKRALGMADHLADLGHSISIVAMDCHDNREQIAAACDRRISVHFYTHSGPLHEMLQKTRIVRNISPDHLFYCSYSFRNRVWKRMLPRQMRIAIEHSELSSCIKGQSFLQRMMGAYFERRSLYIADHIVCASKYLFFHYKHRVMQSGMTDKPVSYLPYAYADSISRPDADLRDALQARYGGFVNVVFMGTMISNYGLFVMLDAIAALQHAAKPYMLHLLGAGPDLQIAKEYAAAKGISAHVHFAGYVEEQQLSAYFSMADAFLVPLFNTIQDWARCPSKTYMYIPFMKPVFTCRVGESAELFTDERLFFRSSDSNDLAMKLETLMQPVTHILPDPAQHTWKRRAEDLSALLTDGFGA